MGERERKFSHTELMSRLGDAQPGSVARPPLEAEYERRKFLWQRVAVVIAGVGVFIAIAGVIIELSLTRLDPAPTRGEGSENAAAVEDLSVVITGLDPVIPLRAARCQPKRDARDKPGHDKLGISPPHDNLERRPAQSARLRPRHNSWSQVTYEAA